MTEHADQITTVDHPLNAVSQAVHRDLMGVAVGPNPIDEFAEDTRSRTGVSGTRLSSHARARLRQRSVPPFVVRLLFDHGVRERSHRGAVILFFDKRSRSRVAAELGRSLFSRLDSHFLDAYAVVSRDGEVVTVGYRTKRVKRGIRAARLQHPRRLRVRNPSQRIPPDEGAIQDPAVRECVDVCRSTLSAHNEGA